MIAEFSKWVPEGVETLKGIVVIVPCSQADGRDEVTSRYWQSFARRNKVGLVGCFFQDDEPGWIEDYCNVKQSQSGVKLIEYLQANFTKQQVDPTKILPPIFLWGFSAGGQFAHEFACKYPNLVGGFVVNKGGVYYTALTPPATRKIPALFIVGLRDHDSRIDILRGIFKLNRRAGARWEMMEEDTSHREGLSVTAGMRFFEGILNPVPKEELPNVG